MEEEREGKASDVQRPNGNNGVAMKKKPILDQYRGRLTPEKAAEGMRVAAANAERLVADAEILLGAKRFPSACALAILAIEELGKRRILLGIASSMTEVDLAKWWKNYRDHGAKNLEWITTLMYASGARTFKDFLPMYDKQSDHSDVLEGAKQLSVYTDCLADEHWSEPAKAIDESIATPLVKLARQKCIKVTMSPREIELWVALVAPKAGTDKLGGVIAYYETLELEGLSRHRVEKVKAFLQGMWDENQKED